MTLNQEDLDHISEIRLMISKIQNLKVDFSGQKLTIRTTHLTLNHKDIRYYKTMTIPRGVLVLMSMSPKRDKLKIKSISIHFHLNKGNN